MKRGNQHGNTPNKQNPKKRVPKKQNVDRKNSESKNGYGPQTAGLIAMLSKVPEDVVKEELNKIKTKESNEQRVYVSDSDDIKELHIEGPSYTNRADVIFLSALQDGLKKGTLAKEYLNISPNRFSMIRNPTNGNKPNVDLIVIAALVNRQPFPLEVVNHVLMEIELPGLFTDTYNYDLNLRNYILARILTYAQDHPCPRERWIHFAREALDYLNMAPLQDLPAVTCSLSIEEEEMLTIWLSDARRACVRTDYMVLRRTFLDRFAQENYLADSKVVSYLTQISFSNTSTTRDVFASDFAGEGTHGSRETLIHGAVHMGCSLEEANTMLRQANYALLYPFRQDNTDAVNIALLLRNEIARRKRQEELKAQEEKTSQN